MIPHQSLTDLKFDSATNDFAVVAGDLAPFITSYDDILTQLIIDALESKFNSMKTVLRNWGFESRDVELSKNNPDYDSARQIVYLHLSEMLYALSEFLILDIQKITPKFYNNNTFTFRLECVLNDIQQTSFDKTFTWNGNTGRASAA